MFISDDEDIISAFWNQTEISLVLQAFNKFGDDFETISQLIRKFFKIYFSLLTTITKINIFKFLKESKTPESIK